MRRTTLAIVALVGIASVASAADLPRKAPVAAPIAPPVYSWTGFYVGGDVGGLRTRASGRWDPLPEVPFFGTIPIAGDLRDTGFVGGLHAGYNWQFAPSWVAGIEGDWSWTNAEGSFTQSWTRIVGSTLSARPTALTTMSVDPNWLATIRGRIGYLVVPTALLYFTGGAAWADVDRTASANNEPERPDRFLTSASLSKTVNGYVLGGGLEWAFWSHWSVRAEYLYYHLNTSGVARAFDSTGNFPPPLGSQFSWGNTDLQTVRVGASYKF
jgi:outer membrane immunogenic protein